MTAPNLQIRDRVLESCAAPGTGTVTLRGIQTGAWQSFDIVGTGNTCDLCIVDQYGTHWEVQRESVFTLAGRTLSRTAGNVVDGSSGPGVLVNFSSGVQDVFLDRPSIRDPWPSGKTAPSAVTLTLPAQFVLGQTLPVTVTVAGSGATPTGTVSLLDGSSILATGPLVAGVVTFAGTLTVAGSHSLTAAYSGDINYAAATSTASVVQAVAPSFADSFQQAGRSTIGPNWSIFPNSGGNADTWSVSGGYALPGGGNTKHGTICLSGWDEYDATVQADVVLTGGTATTGGGPVQRETNGDVKWAAMIQSDGAGGAFGILCQVTAAAVAQLAGAQSGNAIATASTYTVRFVTAGHALFMFVNGVLAAYAAVANLPQPGTLGLFDTNNAVKFQNFAVSAGASFTDSFLRIPGVGLPAATLSLGYTEDVGSGFGINASNKATPNGGAGLSVATLTSVNVPQCDVKLVIASEGTGAAGLVVQWDSVALNGYAVLLSATQIKIKSIVAGAVSSTLATYSVTALGAADVLEVQAVGSTLTVFLNGVFVGTYTDPSGSYTGGTAGFIADNASVLLTSFTFSKCIAQEW